MGPPVTELTAGVLAAVNVLSHFVNGRPSRGALVDTCMFDVTMSMLSYVAPLYLSLGQIPERVGSGHLTIYPYNAFEAADANMVMAPFTRPAIVAWS